MTDILVDMSEYHWLQWFAAEADFGPGHGDVMVYMIKRYESETGDRVPENRREGYFYDEEDDQ